MDNRSRGPRLCCQPSKVFIVGSDKQEILCLDGIMTQINDCRRIILSHLLDEALAKEVSSPTETAQGHLRDAAMSTLHSGDFEIYGICRGHNACRFAYRLTCTVTNVTVNFRQDISKSSASKHTRTWVSFKGWQYLLVSLPRAGNNHPERAELQNW